MGFNDWYNNTQYRNYSWSCKGAAELAWDSKESELQSKIQRIEAYPTCMSCYPTVEEMQAAKAMKETILKILKEEK